MKKKSLSVKKKIHNKLLINLKHPSTYKIYKDFSNFLEFNLNKSNFSVALSGGTDSLALTFLLKCYSLKNKLNAKFFVVDHKLRKDSSEEAKTVKLLLKKYQKFIESLKTL